VGCGCVDGASTVTWRRRAACRGMDPNVFHPGNHDPKAWREARAICAGCEVRVECLRFAIDTGESHGVWGGMSPKERLLVARGDR
jgi:WhiB family transcriptional regulator, redox-sensing transcriptional regulator